MPDNIDTWHQEQNKVLPFAIIWSKFVKFRLRKKTTREINISTSDKLKTGALFPNETHNLKREKINVTQKMNTSIYLINNKL